MITECDSLGAAVKRFELKIAELEQSLVEKNDQIKDLEEGRGKVQLAGVQDEVLKSYKEGYRDCWGRFASGVAVDPSSNTFEIFLSDLKAKAGRDGVGSSNQALEGNP